MFRRFILAISLTGAAAAAVLPLVPAEAAALPTASEVLAGIDKNMTFDTRSMTVKMTSLNPRRSREFKMTIFGRGENEAAIQYVEPVREAGTKMLRNGDELWMYMPAVEKTQKISGHMLRQGMMGTDVSYEDMMAASDLASVYDAKVIGGEDCGTGDGRQCWKMEMVAKDPSVSYPKRTAWVDQEYAIVVRQELYALEGKLLKTWTMSGIQRFDGTRWFPTKMTITDKLLEGTSTTLEFSDVKFGVPVEAEIFSTRWLERAD